ncbi:MAG: DUF1467 family protein [Sphingomonadales bacterium]|nr:DUF1467 family protein [Sphingomonadales bacterium]NCQ20863.1 DUF1467 family protein [Sphingomonadales bacterium]NCT02620.1 DUF1467 family protein [Sphingomonadales bacterium]
MQITSIAAIYFLFWVISAFLMLPFGVRTAEEAGEATVPGQAESAPVNFRPKKLMLRATVFAALATGLFLANYEYRWITVADIDILPKPPSAAD